MKENPAPKKSWLTRLLRWAGYCLAVFLLCLALAAMLVLKNSGWSLNRLAVASGMGYTWAKWHDIRSHALCRERWPGAAEGFERTGCGKYVTEQNVLKVIKPIPEHHGFDDGTTTAECIAEVRAYWDPIINDYIEQGEYHLAQSRTTRAMGPLLDQCRNFDNIRIGRVIYQPQARIDAILKKVREGGAVTLEDKLTVKKDYPGVLSFPDDQYRTKYLASAETFFDIAGGRENVLSAAEGAPGAAPPPPSAPDLPSAASSVALDDETRKLNEESCMELDRLAATGAGMVQRPAPQPQAPHAAPPPDSNNGRFVPQPRSFEAMQARRHLEMEELQKETERKNAESAARLTSEINKSAQNCGGKLTDYPAVGMTDEYFRNCTIQARFAGVTQIVAAEHGTIPLRLYVFPTDRAKRVYSVNGVVVAVKP